MCRRKTARAHAGAPAAAPRVPSSSAPRQRSSALSLSFSVSLLFLGGGARSVTPTRTRDEIGEATAGLGARARANLSPIARLSVTLPLLPQVSQTRCTRAKHTTYGPLIVSCVAGHAKPRCPRDGSKLLSLAARTRHKGLGHLWSSRSSPLRCSLSLWFRPSSSCRRTPLHTTPAARPAPTLARSASPLPCSQSMVEMTAVQRRNCRRLLHVRPRN